MICAACQDRRHAECRGGTWCDCQHLPPPDPPVAEDVHQEDRPEPGVNWLRQG